MEIEIIADELGVPSGKRQYFLKEAYELVYVYSNLRKEIFTDSRIFKKDAIKALLSAEKSIGKAVQIMRPNLMYLSLTFSPEISKNLAHLLNHPSAKSLLPEERFVSPNVYNIDSIPQFMMLAHESPNILDDIAGDMTTYAEEPASTFVNLLELLQIMLALEIRNHKSSSGGRPKDRIRFHLLKEILSLHERVFEERATSAPGGLYSRLCCALFESCNESIDGLEEAIKRFLRQQRSTDNK